MFAAAALMLALVPWAPALFLAGAGMMALTAVVVTFAGFDVAEQRTWATYALIGWGPILFVVLWIVTGIGIFIGLMFACLLGAVMLKLT